MKTFLTLTCLALAGQAAVGQESFASRITAGVSIVSTQGDYRDFTANPNGFGFEVTCDITRALDQALNFRGFLSFFMVGGKYREVFDTSFSLNGMSLGADVTFKTPSDKVVPYAGIFMTSWSASHDGLGNLLERQVEFDSDPKLGFRFGVDYSVTEHIIVGANFNMSEWRSHRDYAANPSNPLVVKGFNPVNPSWVNITGRWRF